MSSLFWRQADELGWSAQRWRHRESLAADTRRYWASVVEHEASNAHFLHDEDSADGQEEHEAAPLSPLLELLLTVRFGSSYMGASYSGPAIDPGEVIVYPAVGKRAFVRLLRRDSDDAAAWGRAYREQTLFAWLELPGGGLVVRPRHDDCEFAHEFVVRATQMRVRGLRPSRVLLVAQCGLGLDVVWVKIAHRASQAIRRNGVLPAPARRRFRQGVGA